MMNNIVLHDENGNVHEFIFLDCIEYMDEEYVVLIQNGDNEVIILMIDGDEYVSVVNDDTLHQVYEIFKAEHIDEFNFI